jgi:hypothetical protein
MDSIDNVRDDNDERDVVARAAIDVVAARRRDAIERS